MNKELIAKCSNLLNIPQQSFNWSRDKIKIDPQMVLHVNNIE